MVVWIVKVHFGVGGANVFGSIDGEVMSQEWHCKGTPWCWSADAEGRNGIDG